MRMTKTLLLILAVLTISTASRCQTIPETGLTTQVIKQRGGYIMDSVLRVPVRTPTAIYPLMPMIGRIQIRSSDSTFQYHNGIRWIKFMPLDDAVTTINNMNSNIALKTPMNRKITINEEEHDLSSDASFNVGTLKALDTISLSNRINNKLSKESADIFYEPLFSKSTGFNKNFGTVINTVVQGNDSRVLNGQTAFSWGNHSLEGYLKSINSSMINSALSYTPYNGTINSEGFLKSYNESDPIWTSVSSSYRNKTQNDLLYKAIGYIPSWSEITSKPSFFSGNYVDLIGKPTLFSGDYNDLINKPTSPTYNNSPSRSLNVSYRISTTKPTRVSYTISVISAITVGQAIAFLEISSDNTTWITINSAGETSVGLLNTKYYNIQGEIPVNYYCRIRTATTLGGTLGFVSGQEVTY